MNAFTKVRFTHTVENFKSNQNITIHLWFEKYIAYTIIWPPECLKELGRKYDLGSETVCTKIFGNYYPDCRQFKISRSSGKRYFLPIISCMFPQREKTLPEKAWASKAANPWKWNTNSKGGTAGDASLRHHCQTSSKCDPGGIHKSGTHSFEHSTHIHHLFCFEILNEAFCRDAEAFSEPSEKDLEWRNKMTTTDQSEYFLH